MSAERLLCGECGASVVRGTADELVRSCEHTESAVILDMGEVTLYGEQVGEMEVPPPPPQPDAFAILWQKVFGNRGLLACAVCGAPAVRKNEKIVRACNHTDAEVLGG